MTNRETTPMRFSHIALVAAALAVVTPAPSAAQNECTIVSGIGQVSSTSTCFEADGYSTVMITLQGSMTLVTHDLPNVAIVTCWVCEGGNCSAGGTYGPSRVKYELAVSGSAPTTVNWTVPFRFSNDALTGATSSFPSFSSYYCRLELEKTVRGADSGFPAPPTIPDPFADQPHARTQQGAQLVTALQGSFSTPISNRAQ